MAGEFVSGWYYQRQLTWETDATAPEGEHFVTIRNQESNWGNFVVDQMRTAFGEEPAELAFINSGTLRIDDYIAGDITFDQPTAGNRVFDFNTEGMVHLGLVAELIQDVRGDGVSDEELEPLFKSAEGYLRMWEKAESRGEALSGGAP